MDIGVILGILLGIGLTGTAIYLGAGASGIIFFVNIPAMLLTIGGVVASLLVAYPVVDILNALKAMRIVFTAPRVDNGQLIRRISELSSISRKVGVLAFEEAIQESDDVFLRKGILAIIDGKSIEALKNMLETEIANKQTRHAQTIQLFLKIAELAPAWGLFGTVIGLALMFNGIADVVTLGSTMSVALMSTIYGMFLSNLFANPIANKLSIKSQQEIHHDEIVVVGLLAIRAGENTRMIEEKMIDFMRDKEENILPKETAFFGGDK